MLYGFPGAGKTYFARQFCENVQAAHLQSDRIRSELFEEPRYDKRENEIVSQLMNYMEDRQYLQKWASFETEDLLFEREILGEILVQEELLDNRGEVC